MTTALACYNIHGEPLYRDLETRDEQREVRNWLYAQTPMGNIFIHPKFVTDGASIPWYVRWLIPKSGKWNRAALIHDFLYKYGGFWNERGEFIKVTRKQADEIYYELCLSRGVTEKNAKTQWAGLRVGGFVAWNKHRKNDYKWQEAISSGNLRTVPPRGILRYYDIKMEDVA